MEENLDADKASTFPKALIVLSLVAAGLAAFTIYMLTHSPPNFPGQAREIYVVNQYVGLGIGIAALVLAIGVTAVGLTESLRTAWAKAASAFVFMLGMTTVGALLVVFSIWASDKIEWRFTTFRSFTQDDLIGPWLGPDEEFRLWLNPNGQAIHVNGSEPSVSGSWQLYRERLVIAWTPAASGSFVDEYEKDGDFTS